MTTGGAGGRVPGEGAASAKDRWEQGRSIQGGERPGRDGLTGGQWAGSGWPHIPPVERRGLEPHHAHLGAQALERLTASLLSRGFPSLS